MVKAMHFRCHPAIAVGILAWGLCLGSSLAQQAAVLEFKSFNGKPAKPEEPKTFTIKWGTITSSSSNAFAANDRIVIHLPGFAGAYNSFGTLSPSIQAASEAQLRSYT